MSLFLNFRELGSAGGIVEPYLLVGNGTTSPPSLDSVPWNRIGSHVDGKNVLLVAHGFNVSYERGARSLGRLEQLLGLEDSNVFIGVLWPGDWWLPVVNYPFEGDDAIRCGRLLAAFCNRWLARAQSISLASHSLGARVVLEATRNLSRPVRSVCLTAAAIQRSCLGREYAGATANASSISILASHEDWVLQLAFRVGDPFSEILSGDHESFERALGYDGPPTPANPPITHPWQIPDREKVRHGDYLPPGDAIAPLTPLGATPKWSRVAAFIARAFRGQPQTWP